ncbi:epsin-3-like isoform X1 [Lates japonicus]|uniref:Epsin-3-like isoform X1 n=1 Tax=Lates japonicus TaxID=270547 RepID=A0AAD3RLA0_LATJO|nr:epsin-3-like isoform X1 [Lates japonicus]
MFETLGCWSTGAPRGLSKSYQPSSLLHVCSETDPRVVFYTPTPSAVSASSATGYVERRRRFFFHPKPPQVGTPLTRYDMKDDPSHSILELRQISRIWDWGSDSSVQLTPSLIRANQFNVQGRDQGREACSSATHWGPPARSCRGSGLLTFNVVAFTEVMGMIWAAQAARTGAHALRDFPVHRPGRGPARASTSREEAKQLVALLEDEEKLKGRRARR